MTCILNDMPGYFLDEGEILQYADAKSNLSFQELYAIYAPTKSMIQNNLREQRKKATEILGEIAAVRDRLALHVPYADLDTATALSTIWLTTDLEQINELIALNSGILRLIEGSYTAESVKAIPMTDFIDFKKRWAKCPFHPDTRASFYYYPMHNRAHCFSGCGQKNIIQVFAVLNDCSNKEAFTRLKERLA